MAGRPRGQRRYAGLVDDEALLDARPASQPAHVDAQKDDDDREHADEDREQGHEDRAVEGVVAQDFLDRLV